MDSRTRELDTVMEVSVKVIGQVTTFQLFNHFFISTPGQTCAQRFYPSTQHYSSCPTTQGKCRPSFISGSIYAMLMYVGDITSFEHFLCVGHYCACFFFCHCKIYFTHCIIYNMSYTVFYFDPFNQTVQETFN